MPNWCNNTLTISHEDITKIEDLKVAINKGHFFKHILPIPVELTNTVAGVVGETGSHEQLALEAQTAANIEKYGYSSWYDFCIAKWGTKWEASDSEIIDEDNNWFSMIFTTAWSEPLGIYEELTTQGFKVDAKFYEPNCCFCGEYTSNDGLHVYQWDDLKSAHANIPSHIDAEFSIIEYLDYYEDDI